MGLFDDIIQEHGSSPKVADTAEAALKGSIFDDSENRPQREAIYLPGKPTLGSEIPHRRQEIAEPEPVASTRTDDSDFYRGVKTTLQQLPQLGYGLLAGLGAVAESAQGEEGGLAGKIKEVGLAGYQDWGDRIQVNAKPSDSFTHSWERAKQGDYGALLDWAQHALGYSVGQTAQMLTGAGLAKLGAQAVLQTGAKRLVGGMVKKEVGKLIAKQAASKTATALGKKELTALATKNVARKIGERAFLATTAFGMEGGEIMGDLAKEATRRGELLSGEEIAKGLAATVGAGSLEYISDKFGLDVLMGKSKLLKMANQVTGKKGRVARAAIAGVGMGGTEQATEYAQTGLEQYGKGQALNTEAAATERRDAGMQALFGSGLIGAGRGAITAPVAKIQPQDKDINVFEFLDEQGDKHDLSRMPDAGLQARQEVQELRNEDAEVISPDSTAADPVQEPSAAAQSTIAVPGMETSAPQQNAPSEQNSLEIPLPEEPLLPDTEMAAHAAATSPLNDLPEPSLAQKQKGNYKKGHRRILGLDISIENPAGSERSGVDPDGMPWSQTMMNHYGYIKGTTGKDKDHLDVFLGPGADQLGNGVEQVAVIDQIDPQSGRFDEHKIILGVTDAFEAQSVYLPNYDETGPQRIGAITMMSAAQFKDWLKGNTKKPVAYVPTEKETQTVPSLQEPGKRGPAVQEPIQPAAEEGLAESSSQAPKVTNLYSGIPLSELKKLGGNLRKAMPHLVALGQQVYQSGAQTLDAFKQAMKQALGNLYQRFKDGMIQVFQKVKALAKDQRGSFSMKPDTAYLLSQAKQDLKAGTTTPERLQSLRDAYEALPDGDLKVELRELGKQYSVAQKPANKEQTLQEKVTAELPAIASPTAQKHVPKELVKTRIATQFIGEGSDNSSTDRYRKLYEKHGVANTGKYSPEDVIYVSSNGARGGRISPVVDGKLQGAFKNIDKAIAAGATIVMDTTDHLQRTAKYNLGELALAEYMAKAGYQREGKSGVWKPAQKPANASEAPKELANDRLKRMHKELNPKDHRSAGMIDLQTDIREELAESGKSWKALSENEKHAVLDTITTYYPQLQAKSQQEQEDQLWDAEDLLVQAEKELDQGQPALATLEQLRTAYRALPDGDLKAQLKEVGKQYRRAVETIQQPAEKPAQQPSASQPTRKLSQKEQAFKDWQVLEEVAPQDISEDELKKLRDKRYAQILNEGRTGIPADNETDVTLDMEKADSEVYEPTNWGRSVNAAMLDEMKGYDETTTFAHRVEQDRKTRAFNKIRRLQDLPKDMHDKTPSEAELERINTEARKENERVLQRVYQNMGSNPKLAEGKPSLRDVIANELKWLGETYLLRDIIDYIKREEKVSSLSRLTDYPDALFDFISHHESLSEAQPLSSEEATAETPGLRFVQRVIHALNPRLLREVKRLKDDTGLEAKRLFESFQRGEKGLFPEREYRKIQPIIALMFRQPQKLIDFARQYGADLERFSNEFGKTVNNRFQEAYITPKLLNAIVTAANAEDYVFDKGLPYYDSLINAEAKEQADQRKTAIPRRKVPAVKEPKLNRAKLRRQWLTAQYRNFKKRFAGEYDSLIAENWLAFFQAVRELATTGRKTAANQLNISTIATKMRYAKGLHNRSTEAFKSLPNEVREQVVARMLEHSKLNRPWRKYKNRPAYRGEGVVTRAMLDEAEKSGTPLDLKVGDPLPSGYPVAENIEQNKESTQLGEEVFVDPADAVWSDERFGIDDTPGQLDMVKTDTEGNLLRFEQANDIEFLLGELMMSSAGEAVAQQRGYPDLETYHKYLVRKFTQGWPKVTPANPTKAYYARRDAIRDDIYRELPFARAALLTQQFQQDRIFSVDAFDEMARQYRQQAQPWIDQLAVNARKNHRLNAAELYNIFVSTGSLSAVTNEINRRIHEVRQLVADTNHAELSHEDTQRKAARKIARTHLTEKQQKLFDQLAKKLKNGQFTNEANAIWQEIKLPVDRAALDAAFQIEQDLIDGKIDIADVKVDHGIQVFPEDIFQALDRQAEVARLQKERDALAQQEKEARLKKDTAKIAELVAAQKQTVIDQRLVDVLTVEGIVTGKLRNATAQKFYEAVAKAFGATLVIVSDPTYASRYDGAKQQIIVNIQQNAPIHKLIAHELFHHIVNRADAAAYKTFVRAVKGMVGQERWDAARARFEPLDMGSVLSSLTAEGDARLSEEMLADLFAEVFTQTGFYEMLSESVPGRTLAQRIIGRLLMLAQKIMGAFDGKSRWGYEETLLLGPSSMAEVHRLLGELISSMGKAQHQEVRYYGTFGLQRSDVQAKLSPLMQKIFPAGSSKRTAILDAIEKAAVWTVRHAKEATRWFMADVGAIKPAVKLATDLAYTAEREVQRFDAEVVSRHGDAFDSFIRQKIKTAQQKIRAAHAAGKLSAEEAQILTERFNANHIREILHDDFVRQPLSQEALQAKYPAAIHAAFADMQTWADAIAEQLKAIDPSFNPREHHYLQSIKWRHRNAEPFDDSFAAILERSRLEGNKDFLKTKDTQRTTAEIREEGFEYRTVDPLEMARQYVRDAYQLIAYRKMIVDGQSMESGEGGKMIRAFATPEQAHRAGYRPVNDHATKLNMRLDLPVGYRIKLDKGYLQEGGVDQVYGSQEEAQRKADAYRKAFGEPASVEAVRGQHRVTEGPQWMLVAIDADGNRIESSQRFETMEQAQQRLASRSRYLADGTFVGDLGTHTKDGHRLVVEKERIAPEQVGVARLYFHPHLQRMIDRIIAPNPLLTGKVGKIGRKVMAVKNEMTMWEFAFSLFHGFTQAQELMADAATRAIQEKKGLAEWARSFNPVHAFRNAQKIASLLEYVAKHPEQAHDAAIQEEAQKLFGRPGVDLAELIAMNAMAGGLMEMDASVQAKTHAMGKMRYRSKPHMVTIQEGKVVYEAGEFGLAKGLPYATGSIKAVYDKMLLEEPNAQTKALFKAGRFALAEGSAAWLMQYAIPRIKMAVQAQSYLTALDQNRERLAAGLTTKQNLAYETMMFVEDKFGEYNWQNMWLNPSVKTLLQFTFRSFTWVLGNFTGLGKSGYDFVQWGWINLVRGKYGKPDAYRLTDKGWWAINAFIGHMLTVSALCVIYQLALGLSGDDEAPEEEGVPMLTKLLFPRMDPNDPSYRVQFGSYVTETWKIFSHMGAFGNDMEPAKLFTGRLSSIIGQGVEAFYHGSDWRGTQIARSDDSLPVAFGKKLWHTLAIAPISVSSFMSQTQRKGFEPGQAIIAFLGMTDAPASAKRSAATNAAFALRRKENPGKPVDADAASLRDRVSRAARAHAKGDPKPLQDLIAQGEISPSKARKALERLPLIDNQPNPKYVTPLEQALKGLTLEGAMAVWEEMTADEQRRYRRLLIRKYGNAMSNKNKSRNDKKRLKQRMQALKIL